MGRLKLLGEQESGGTADHSALSNLDYAHSAHTGFVPSQGEALIDILRLNQNLIRDSGGNNRIQLAPTSPHISLAGDVVFSGYMGSPNICAGRILYIDRTIPSGMIRIGISCNATASGGTPIGIFGGAVFTGTLGAPAVRGLFFAATNAAPSQVTALDGLYMLVQIQSSGNVGTASGAILEKSYTGSGRPTISRGLFINDFGADGVGTAYGLHICNQTGAANNYLIEAGPATPYLRLLGGANPGPNQTNLFLGEGATPTLRRVQWKDGAAIGGGDKVMVLV